ERFRHANDAPCACDAKEELLVEERPSRLVERPGELPRPSAPERGRLRRELLPRPRRPRGIPGAATDSSDHSPPLVRREHDPIHQEYVRIALILAHDPPQRSRAERVVGLDEP